MRKSIIHILCYFLLVQFPIGVYSNSLNKDSLIIELLLNRKNIKDAKLTDKFINNIEVTPANYILLSSSNQFYLAGWGGIHTYGKKPWGSINSYAFTTQGILMAVRNNELCYLDSLGGLVKLFKLPNQNMGISSGKYLMYVYDRNSSTVANAIYAIAQGGKYVKLLEMPKPVNSLVEFNNAIFFSNENAIFKFDLQNKELTAVVALPNKKEIKSLSIDTSNNKIYFSTDSLVCAVKGQSFEVITNKLGGIVKYFGKGLIVFNPGKQMLIRLHETQNTLVSSVKKSEDSDSKQSKVLVGTAPTATIAPVTTQTVTQVTKPTPTTSINPQDNTTTPPKEIITNTSIIKLTKAKLSDDLIIDVIKTSEVNFDLKVESMVNLSNNGVSSAVIKEMKAAMEKKNNK